MTSQRLDALERANVKRLARADYRRRLPGDADLLRAVLLDPPDDLKAVRLHEIVAWSRKDRCARTRGIESLGRRAVVHGVNLMMPLGRASLRSREWLATDPMIVGCGRTGRRAESVA